MENNESHNSAWVDNHLSALDPNDRWQPDTNSGFTRLLEGTKASARARTQRYVIGFTTCTVAAACLIVFPSTRVFAERCVAACVGESSPIRRILWPTATTVGIPARRQVAPDFALLDASGNPVRLSDFRGKVVLLNFWATWCPPCRIEIPWFDEFQQTHADRGLVVLGVSMDDDGWNAVKPYIESHGIKYRMVVGNDEIARLYGGLDAVPTTFILDRSGRIAATYAGLTTRQVFESSLEGLLDSRE